MDFLSYMSSSNSAKNVNELLRDFLRFLENFGLQSFVLAEVSRQTIENKNATFGILANYPEEWLLHYKNNGYADHDPVYNRSFTARNPYSWSDITAGNVSKMGWRVMNEAKEHGLCSGIGVPIHRPFGRLFGFGFASPETSIRSDKNTMSIINVASQHFFIVYSGLCAIESTSQSDDILTRREKEVLQWIAFGKSRRDVAELLAVSESCIKRHCENVFEKLGANCISFAVLKALRDGLISPF